MGSLNHVNLKELPHTALVEIEYSDPVFTDKKLLKLIETDSMGSTYESNNGDKSHPGWLCPVFFWNFQKSPELLDARMAKV